MPLVLFADARALLAHAAQARSGGAARSRIRRRRETRVRISPVFRAGIRRARPIRVLECRARRVDVQR
jgi:hypothetical protein